MIKINEYKLSSSILFSCIILIVSAVSCLNKNRVRKYTEEEEKFKAVVIKSCDNSIANEGFKIDSKLLYGQWEESIVWVQNQDLTRTGIRYIYLRSEYEFINNAHFGSKFFFKDSLLDLYVGKFKLIEEGTKIEIMSNLRNDFDFKNGDTIRQAIHRVHLLNDSILRIEEDPRSCRSGTIVEYRRK